jgi:hypothetical protein
LKTRPVIPAPARIKINKQKHQAPGRPLAAGRSVRKFLSQETMVMNKFEKRLCVLAIVFVAVYLAAAGITIHSRVSDGDKTTRIVSAEPDPAEGNLMLAELFLPMLILLTVTVCFIIVRKKRSKTELLLEESEDEFQ